MLKKNSHEMLSSLWNIFKNICFTTQLTKTLQVFIHKIDCTRCLLLLTTVWREEGKLKTTPAFLYLINFDFLNCAHGTKSRNVPQMVNLKYRRPPVPPEEWAGDYWSGLLEQTAPILFCFCNTVKKRFLK